MFARPTLICALSLVLIPGAFRAIAQENAEAAVQPQVQTTESTDAEESQAKPGALKKLTVEDVELAFRYCPAGEFMMGKAEDETDGDKDEVQHKATLTQGFWLLETEVTQEMWTALMGDNPSKFKGENLPVERVSWDDCQEYLAKLNESGAAPDGWEFRLPSECQWEYACRAGATGAYSWGESLNGDNANCNGKYPRQAEKGAKLGKTAPVKSYEPNAWGLYDMHGNVSEWTDTVYDNYPEEDEVDPNNQEGANRIARGGGWNSSARGCRAAFRTSYSPSSDNYALGFRVALVQKQ